MFQNTDRYTKTRCLGSGHYGYVYLATPINPKAGLPSHYAMKMVKHSGLEIQNQQQAILKSLRHPNVLRLYDSYRQGDNTVLILEYAQKGDLSHYAQSNHSVSEEQLTSWIAQITLGLDYLHNTAHVIHRDVKPHNILVMQNGLLKLADFGIAKRLEAEEFAKTSLGTPCYLSPEMILRSEYNYKTDIWGLGCSLYQLCSGAKPFEANSFKDLLQAILYGDHMQIPKTYPEWLRELVSSMLAKEAKERPDAKKILAIKEIQKAVQKLKETYPNEYKQILTEIEIPKTTKYFQREEQHFSMPLKIAQSLKTAKRSEKPKPQNLRASSRPNKIDERFYNRSLHFLIQQSQQQQQSSHQ